MSKPWSFNKCVEKEIRMGDLYALDFDGVLCDSCGESSLSAVKAAKVRWPGLFQGLDSALEEWIVDQMHTETGATTPRKREQKQQAFLGFKLLSSPHLAISLSECILIRN